MPAILKRIIIAILTFEARLVLKRRKPRIIAVTGSVGKTTTKDAIYATLSPHLYIRKSEKTLNTDIGVPLSILGLHNAWHNPFLWIKNFVLGLWRVFGTDAYPHWLVLEIGADRPGDIRSIARWLRPDIVVLTGVPEVPVHVEFFSSPEEVVREKRSLVEFLRPGGKVIVNGDSPAMRQIEIDFRGACITYGMGDRNDYFATHEEIYYEGDIPKGMQFRLNHDGSSLPVTLPGALGMPRVYAALAALAVGEVVEVDSVSGVPGLAQWEPPPGRMRIIAGLRGSTIIDDTYNSSPVAALAALDCLKSLRAHRKIAILGDMLELGKYSSDAHKEVGRRAAQCADILITIGFRSRALAQAALDEGMDEKKIRQYEHGEARRVGKEIEEEIGPGDCILVKGSQSMRMERTVEEIMEDPIHAADLLVRQEPEWLQKE